MCQLVQCDADFKGAEKLQLLLSVHITVIKPCWHERSRTVPHLPPLCRAPESSYVTRKGAGEDVKEALSKKK